MINQRDILDRAVRDALPNLSRRRFTMGLLVSAGAFINPWRGNSGSFELIKPAEAAWLQVAALALSAFSAFSKGGDSGLGAYLANIKSLSEENIRLTQQVLVGIGQIQAQIEQLPWRLREIFLEVEGYKLRQVAQQAWDMLRLVEVHYKDKGKISADDRRNCRTIIDQCAWLAGARSAPYGRGGTAAACAPLIGAVEARAWWFLGESENFRQRVDIAYLPWFNDMLTDQDGSLMRALREEGAKLVTATEGGLNGLPDSIRQALKDKWLEAQVSEPGQTTGTAKLACGSYARHTGNRRGRCLAADCVGDDTPVRFMSDPILEKVLKANELTPFEAQEIQRESGVQNFRPGRCFCTAWEQIPIYTAEGGAALNGRLINEQMPNRPPQLRLDDNWQALSAADGCPDYVKGEDADPNSQFGAVRDSAAATQIRKQIQDWQNQALATYNDQRAVVYATYMLMDAVRGAREQFKQAAR